MGATCTDVTIIVVYHPPQRLLALQVLAGKQQESVESRRRLFFAQAAQDVTESQLLSWFQQFGVVEQIELVGENGGTAGIGHGYITMGTNEQAAAALAAVQQNPQAGCPVGYLNYSSPVTVAAEDGTACNGQAALAANADRTVSLLASAAWRQQRYYMSRSRSTSKHAQPLVSCPTAAH